MSDDGRTGPRLPRHGRVRASLTAIHCLLRGLPLLFCGAPATPLRVLCIMALDTLHVLRDSQPMPRKKISELAVFLDFQACTNAAWDHKNLCEADYRALRRRLEKAGLTFWIEAYLGRLDELERRRPPIGGDRRRFDDVRAYREAVVRISLAAVAAIALDAGCLDEALRATRCNSDLETLFRIAMQCQIIDDVMDYTEDRSAGLPSFLTASASLPLAMAWTADAVRSYSAHDERSAGAAYPLRIALHAVTAVTRLVLACRPAGGVRS